ncbi:metallophosphoesterase [Streptomyces sp. B6B3]|uniref:metallophosphoesterase n=1 Tax=Streptomyces sp. B6B3 TaxID=3153570 RepID=UPI00325D7FC0
MVLLAQISDLHLDGTRRATERARRVMDHLRGLPRPIDALLVTGDIADHGAPAEYAEAADLLAAPFPVLACPGNHDDRTAYRETLLGDTGEHADDAKAPINRAHRVGDAAVLMCDATIPGRDEGLLAPETLDWLTRTLADLPRATPVLIAFHQPPVALHHPLADGIRLRHPEDLAAVLAAYPNVAAVLTGHAHTAAASTFAGRPLVVGPAVTWTLRLPWEGDRPDDRDQPPGIAFHVLDRDADTSTSAGAGATDGGWRLTTHFRVVP